MRNIDYSKYNNKVSFLDNLKKDILCKNTEWMPDITISRDPGSGGSIVAAKVARKMKWKLLDKDILKDLSLDLGIPESEFAAIDEHPRGWWVDMVQSLFNPDYISDIKYLAHLSKLIIHVASESQVVVVGRGAGFILPAEKCLRVRIIAHLSTRIASVMKHEQMSKKEARLWVTEVQEKREKFTQQYFGRSSKLISNYDLMINTDHFQLDDVRDMVIVAYYAKFPEMKHAKV
ncbi:MAG: cytidylate kinase-like family protein [bacterium]